MLEIGWTKLVIVGVVALIAIGPKELPAVLRNVGRWIGTIRRMKAEFQSQFQEVLREAEMEDLKKHAEDLNDAARSVTHAYPDGKPFKTD
jgi:sec-independent protein translocase protein TatB